MNSTPSPKAIESNEGLVARADQRLAQAYQQIARADEQIARVNDQISKLERDGSRHPSAPSRRPPRGRSTLRGIIGLSLAAGIFVAAFVAQSSHGDVAKLIVGGWAPHPSSASSPPPEKPGPAAQPIGSSVQLAAAEPVAGQALSSTTPQDGTPTVAAPASPELAQLVQTMARDLARLEQEIEQLKASQEQTARENAKATEQLNAGQEQITRLIAKASEQKASEQNPRPRTSAPPPRSMAAAAPKPAPTRPSPRARAQPRAPTQLQPQQR